MLDLLARLADRSLVVVDEPPGDEARYRLLETIREYAGERLQEAGESEAARQRHAATSWRGGEGRRGTGGTPAGAWLDRLEAEQANLRAALRWWEARGAAEEGLRMGAGLSNFWHWRGRPERGPGKHLAGLAGPSRPRRPAGTPSGREALRPRGR